MGIPKFNKYITQMCSNKSIKKTHLSELSNTVLVIDTSIYLYKFISHGDLLEDMYLFISILLRYSITPVFIFDGKPPPEKRDVILKRSDDKKKAEDEYNVLSLELQNNLSTHEENIIQSELTNLKRKCIRVKDREIRSVKTLMDAYGITYFEAKNEADELCAYLMKNNIAYGCISDDMDMFIYGCKYIIRHLSLLNHTIIIYDYDKICTELSVNGNELTNILLLCGTDYNLPSHNSIYDVFKWHSEYKKLNLEDISFYEYVNNEKKKISIPDIVKTSELFNLNLLYDELYKDIQINNKPIDKYKLHEVLKPSGFFWYT